jgi:hypothetical protein
MKFGSSLLAAMLLSILGFEVSSLDLHTQWPRALATTRAAARNPYNVKSSMTMMFERKGGRIYFGSRLDVNTKLRATDPVALAAFLSDPANVIAASWPAERTVRLGNGNFRLVQDPINFAGLVKIEFFVDVHVDVEPNGRVALQSYNIQTTAQLRGGPPVLAPVEINLQGELKPVLRGEASKIRRAVGGSIDQSLIEGFVAYSSSGPLTGPIAFTPDAVLKVSTDAINTAILTFARRDFVNGIKRNFDRWYTPQRRQEIEARLNEKE